jgi:hypothetical protein
MLDGSEWSPSFSGCFTPNERAPYTQWIGGWMGPVVGLDAVENREIPYLGLLRNELWFLGETASNLVAMQTELSWVP